MAYRRLGKKLRLRNNAVRARIVPDRQTLDRAYKAAAKERWRRCLEQEWKPTETDRWPE